MKVRLQFEAATKEGENRFVSMSDCHALRNGWKARGGGTFQVVDVVYTPESEDQEAVL